MTDVPPTPDNGADDDLPPLSPVVSDNPAQQLYGRTVEWSEIPAGHSIVTHRGPTIEAFLSKQAEALGWLDDVEAEIQRVWVDRGKRGPSYDRMLGMVREILVPTQIALGDVLGNARGLCNDPSALDTLGMLGEHWNLRPVNDEALVQIRAQLVEVQQLVLKHSSVLGEESSTYLMALVEEVNSALNEATIRGTVDVERRVAQLIGSLGLTFAGRAGGESASTIIGKLFTVVRVMGLQVGLPALGQAAATLALMPFTS